MVRTDALDGPFEAAARPKQASGKLQEKLAALEAAHNAGPGVAWTILQAQKPELENALKAKEEAAAATPAATPAAPAVEEAMFQEYLKLCKSSKYVQKNNASGWHVKLKMAERLQDAHRQTEEAKKVRTGPPVCHTAVKENARLRAENCALEKDVIDLARHPHVARCGEDNSGPSIVLLHGLLVNADHWRKNLPALADQGARVYAIDLLGNGYTDRLVPGSPQAKNLSGETARNLTEVETELLLEKGVRQKVTVPQRHPLGSVYNIFTWSEQVTDFVREIVQSEVILVGNSLGSLVSLQAGIDAPELVQGLVLVNPRFRQEHVSEAPALARPLISLVQRLLRETWLGQWLFDTLKTEAAVTEILKEPYFDPSQVTEELVEVLRRPLLMEGAMESTFDILSYSTGPLLEQLLQDERLRSPIWVCWGQRDPWTPMKRVKALDEFPNVEKLVEFPNVGHCPHDESPSLVNGLILDFLQHLSSKASKPA
ncbi:Pheophytinase [Durusdinium trenchii]|uniref:Chloroplastic (Pheophytin pheophorbide hydrolase) (Protein CO-REGULATED WITH NYE1) n=1 Tax=Durusdinium trenchii TaxID=1381693 RepID=A0ABP0P143_9DINO